MALAGASIPCHRASLWLFGCPHATAAGFPWSKMREGGIGEEKGRQSGSCSVFMNSCTPSLPHCPVGHPDQPCNVTEMTERQRSEHREGRTTEARLGASCPTAMEGLLPSYCPPPLPCKRAIRKTEAVIGFFLERTDQPQSLMILNIPQIFINCKEN